MTEQKIYSMGMMLRKIGVLGAFLREGCWVLCGSGGGGEGDVGVSDLEKRMRKDSNADFTDGMTGSIFWQLDRRARFICGIEPRSRSGSCFRVVLEVDGKAAG